MSKLDTIIPEPVLPPTKSIEWLNKTTRLYEQNLSLLLSSRQRGNTTALLKDDNLIIVVPTYKSNKNVAPVDRLVNMNDEQSLMKVIASRKPVAYDNHAIQILMSTGIDTMNQSLKDICKLRKEIEKAKEDVHVANAMMRQTRQDLHNEIEKMLKQSNKWYIRLFGLHKIVQSFARNFKKTCSS